LILMSACLPLLSQNKLRTDEIFTNKNFSSIVIKSSQVTGRSLAPYNLDSFRSICITADEKTRSMVESWVIEDVGNALDTDVEREGEHLTYALLRFPGANTRKHEYLGYQVNVVEGVCRITVVKMSGKATIEDLKSFFKNR